MNTVYRSIKRSFRSLAALLALTLLCSWSLNTAQAQVELSDAEWKIGFEEEDWVTADNTMRGGSLNPVTGNLLVVSRTGGPAIYVVDADDGSVTGELDMEGVSGGDFPINLIKVASDGVIYAANLSVPGSNYRLYRWADEDSEPTLAFEGNPNSTRMGDSFGMYEDDDKVVLMASGTGNDAIFTLTRDKQDDTYTDGLIEDIPAGYARGGFASVDGQDQVWINGYGTPLTLVDLESGDVLLEVPETAIPYQTMEVSFAQIGDRSIAALFPTDTEPEGQYVAIYDVTDAENIAKIGRTAQLGDEENLNGVGSIELDADNQMLYVVGTNNAVAKFDITPALEAVTVVLNFNAATVPDTLRAEDVVQVRGDYSPAGLTWGADSPVLAENIGGDYWQATISGAPGDTIIFKFWTGFSLDPEEPTANGGWEGGDDRMFVIPDDQTGIIASDLLFYNQVELFEEKADSIGIYFRVNIGAQVQQGQFNTDEDRVGVRGQPPLDWDETLFFLNKESRMEGSDNIFYSGVFYAAEDIIEQEGGFDFKFVTDIDGIGWEDGDDRPVRFGEIADTTLQYGFFSGEKPSPDEVELIEADIQFAVNVNVLSNLGIFDDAIDGVELRGNFNSWAGGDELTFNPTLDRYQITRDYSGGDLVSVGQRYAYKYFILWDESREDSESPNYIPGLDAEGAGWEEPGTTGGSDRIYFVTEDAEQTTYPDDPGYDYFNDLPGASVILQEFIEGEPETWPITFRIDMTRATEIPDAEDRFVPGEDSVFIAFEEQIFAFSQGFGTGPGSVEDASNIERNENYLLEDVDGDGIYEITVDAQLPSVNSFGFIIGYGQPNIGEGTITWNGGGFGSGRRYYQFAMPTQVVDFDGILVSYWPAEPDLDVLTWYGGENFNDEGLTVEAAPDYRALLTSSEDARIDTPVTYNLRQNYPNPFNPTTNIEFTIPESHDVRLEVYNILGRRVATLVNTYKNAGTHTVQFDASRLASGMYIYRLQAGDFVQQRQMMLVK
ncbi:T9SS type A sorting domain-containing protein [Natronogracilivirga saccharolytica]|uniref:DUF4623 domain-containing protein n=1 Tax=Natronogracilivirga saccharolytica TaxID=2812953 RepID=A0A8J7RJA0_9BACT|nr:T9SS type A sorting domain-containing protein [Natronogracilivirga saccharolytica]MBP3191208.1 DUF4623 domain-containing protein [Natronogracilivirga saccharolytica]